MKESTKSDRLNQVLRVVQAQPGLSALEIAAESGIHISLIRRYLNKLKAKQLIGRQQGKNRSGHLAKLSYPMQPKS